MIEIPLTKGFAALIDDEDFDLVNQFKWQAMNGRHTTYACAYTKRQKGKRDYLLLHRLITDAANSMEVDHRDSNGLNNTRLNLRVCTTAQNQYNQRIRSDNTSGFKGVGWIARLRKWRAYIMKNGKAIHLGLFTCPIEAAHAYDRKALELFGEFALLNFPL